MTLSLDALPMSLRFGGGIRLDFVVGGGCHVVRGWADATTAHHVASAPHHEILVDEGGKLQKRTRVLYCSFTHIRWWTIDAARWCEGEPGAGEKPQLWPHERDRPNLPLRNAERLRRRLRRSGRLHRASALRVVQATIRAPSRASLPESASPYSASFSRCCSGSASTARLSARV